MEEKKPNVNTDEEKPISVDEINEEDDGDNPKVATDEQKEESTDNPSSETDEQESESESEKDKEEETKAKNKLFAEKRRKQEAEEKARKAEADKLAREQQIREEATLKAKLGMVKTNPYTNDAITDAEDLRIYELQKQLEDEGKDPISDLPKRLAEVERKRNAEIRARQQEEEEKQNQIAKDIQELKTKYPNVNTAELATDTLFQECLNGRAGRWSQVEIYELYLTKKAERQAKESKKQEQDLAKKGSKDMTKVPTSGAGGQTLPKGLNEMSDEEFTEYWNKTYGGQ